MTDPFNDPQNYTIVIMTSVAILGAFLSALGAVLGFMSRKNAAKTSFAVSLFALVIGVCYTVLA